MEPEKSNGALLGAIIILIILIIGGAYLLLHAKKGSSPAPTNESADQDLGSLEADVNQVDVEGFDQGL